MRLRDRPAKTHPETRVVRAARKTPLESERPPPVRRLLKRRLRDLSVENAQVTGEVRVEEACILLEPRYRLTVLGVRPGGA